jgi:hypothetical protein
MTKTRDEFRGRTTTARFTKWHSSYEDAFNNAISIAERDLERTSEVILPTVAVSVEKRTVVERSS